VPQDAFLFSDSIKNNIMFGKENATSQEVEAAAKSAVVHDNIMGFNKQYETILEKEESHFLRSTRFSIARAIIKTLLFYFLTIVYQQ
jgi:ATP-binding cassette subfamily B protein